MVSVGLNGLANAMPKVSFETFHNTIDGSPRSAKSQYHGVNPVTKEELWPVPVATEQDVEDAVAAAHKAFTSWKRDPWKKRKQLLLDFSERVMKYEEAFTNLIILETGKPRFLANAEMTIFADTTLHFSELILPEETVHGEKKFVKTSYVPLGVVAAIGPWNFPLALFMNKLAPAVLTGNCIILKPSPYTPYSILKVAEIAQHVFPPGVIQCLGGSDRLGPWLTHHADIQKVAFTGSAATGKQVMAACARTVKRVTLELGGNDPAIICPDIDVDKVAPELVMGFFLNTGQVCVASKRVYIHADIYPQMAAALARCTKEMIKVGGDEPGVMMGPMQNEMQYQRVKELFAEAKSNNYQFVLGQPDIALSEGYFVQPTIVDNPPSDSRLMTQEQFGPIVPIQPWIDEDDVIQRANDTKTGLSGCVWSKDIHRARRIGEQLDVGSIFINSTQKPSPEGVFGGHKESGLGVEFRLQGLLAYCNPQSLYVNY